MAWLLRTGASNAAPPAPRDIERVDLAKRWKRDWHDDKLCDAITAPDDVIGRLDAEEDYLKLADEPRVDYAWRVEHCDAVSSRKPAAGTHEPNEAVWDT